MHLREGEFEKVRTSNSDSVGIELSFFRHIRISLRPSRTMMNRDHLEGLLA